MTHGSLFSGIGGVDLGLESLGIETKWQVEIDKYANKVLEKRFPDAKRYKDITKLNTKELEWVDVISGGFPCQDISAANPNAEGISGKRSGLWSEMFRIISDLRPRYAFIENVPMLSIRGLDRVLSDLAQIGYDAEWQSLSAKEVGAWHKRERLFIVAYAKCLGWQKRATFSEKLKRKKTPKQFKNSNKKQFRANAREDVAYPRDNSYRTKAREKEKKNGIQGKHRKERFSRMSGGTSGNRKNPSRDLPNPNEERIQGCKETGNLEESRQETEQFTVRYSEGRDYWAVEPNVGRVANGVSNRVDRLKCLGNAVVPQCARIIGEYLIRGKNG